MDGIMPELCSLKYMYASLDHTVENLVGLGE